ncbi:MAG TPA: glycosyltransferase family 2 protein [Ignavibacteriaceae bacterium]|nr:glycosyltransferase family 2 protein [Ignavibacteriaceae bacterium]
MNVINSSSQKIDISIIIVNYNLAKEIEDCLNSLLLKIDSRINFEIIIADNNSPDKSLLAVEEKFKRDNIQFLYLDKNIGFGKGNNYGFARASGKYICFLNPDTLIKEDIFWKIISLFEIDKSIGIIGPQQQIKDPCFDFSAGYSPNIFFELFNLFGLGVFVESFIMFFYTKLKREKKLEVNWILGAAIFVRADLFKRINGFDEDYFMFFEELDLCKRVKNIGLKVVYYPQLKIHHIGSVSGKKDYKLYTIRTYSSKYIYIKKHFKSINKLIMKSLLYTELFSQIILWSILFPINKKKSKQKIEAFFYLLKHNMKYEHRY